MIQRIQRPAAIMDAGRKGRSSNQGMLTSKKNGPNPLARLGPIPSGRAEFQLEGTAIVGGCKGLFWGV